MTTVANMKSLFPKFSSFFDKPDSRAALKNMEPKKVLSFYKALVTHQESALDQKIVALKASVKERLKKHEQKKALSKDKIKTFHELKEKDKKLQKAAHTALPKVDVKPPVPAKPVETAEQIKARKELNIALATLAERFATRPTVGAEISFPDDTPSQFATIALDHLETMRHALSESARPFFTEETISEMDGAAYNAMLDCTLLKLIQVAEVDSTELVLFGGTYMLRLSPHNDFNETYQQLMQLKTLREALAGDEYDTLLRKITDVDNTSATPPRVQALIHAIGQFRSQLEQALRTDRRFLTAFTG